MMNHPEPTPGNRERRPLLAEELKELRDRLAAMEAWRADIEARIDALGDNT
jgi:hypothetical protein